MTKKIALLAFVLGSGFMLKGQTKTELKTPLDSASYAFGLSVAEDLKARGIKGLNYSLMVKAMENAFNAQPPALTREQAQNTIYQFLNAAVRAQNVNAIAEGRAFLEENKKKTGIKTTKSGLQYEVISNGSGPKPKETDEVTVHYKGTLLNRKQFDSSYDRNQPLTIALNQVISGWTEGVQLMPVGSRYRFFIPYELGYGEKGAGNDIPGFSVLIFEIELLKIGK